MTSPNPRPASVAVCGCTLAILLLTVTSLCPFHTRAQDLDDVTISGHVADQQGAFVVGATVTLTLATTGATRTAATDAEGRYRVSELAPGEYHVRATGEGFAVAEKTSLAAIAGQRVALDFTLLPAGVTAEQTVSAEADAAAVDTTRTVVGGTVGREEIESLPNVGRSPLDFVFTLGGVTEEPLSTRDLAEDRDRAQARTPEEAGTFALAGGPAYSNNLTIDGLDNNDDRGARERFQPSLEAVAEVQVITNQFSAEYGRASGGRVNLRTRAGTNQWRGRLFYFFRDESLNANSFYNNARGLKRLPLQQHNPGFTLGGPLPSLYRLFNGKREDGGNHAARARTFFFIADEFDTVLDATLIDTLVPIGQNPLFALPPPTTLAGRRFEASSVEPNQPVELAPYVVPVSTPLRNHALTARVDHTFDDAHNATFLYQRGRLNNRRQFAGGARLADALQGRTRESDALAVSDNYVFSARLVNQLRAQISRLSPSVIARGGGNNNARPVVLISLNDPLPADDPANRAGTLVAGSSNAGASDRRETRWQLQDALSVLPSPVHAFKLGADVQHVRSTFIDLADTTGTFNFASAADFLTNTPNRFRQRFDAESVQRNTYFGLFAQHEWRVRPNFTLTYGLRYEQETIIRDRNNFAPRFALAFDPFRDGRTVVRLGAGAFYNRALLRTIDDFTLGQQRTTFDTDDLRDSATSRVLTDAQRRAFIAANLRFPQALTADAPIVRQFGTRATNFARRLDPRLRIPESYQLNLGFEREVGRRFVVEANFTLNRGAHLWREFNVNAPRLPTAYRDFNAYLLARDFGNFRDAAGTRPLYNVAAAGELVRFTAGSNDPTNPDAVVRVFEFGLPVSLFNLNSTSSTTALNVARAAINELRPDPARGELEQLASIGNSYYRGLTLEARRRFAPLGGGFGLAVRAAYTLSSLRDDGIVNTSDALTPGDFRRERARSLLDRRQRLVVSGVFDLPRVLGALRIAPILRLATGAPFNISVGGVDRNLDDVSNDRPDFSGDLSALHSRAGNDAPDAALVAAFSLPAIGQTGNLPRNAGTGPRLFAFDLNLTREFRFGERLRLRPSVELDNVFNRTVFTFGAEFINFSALRPSATAAQRQIFLDSFLVPTRTLRPRAVRLGVRLDF